MSSRQYERPLNMKRRAKVNYKDIRKSNNYFESLIKKYGGD